MYFLLVSFEINSIFPTGFSLSIKKTLFYKHFACFHLKYNMIAVVILYLT